MPSVETYLSSPEKTTKQLFTQRFVAFRSVSACVKHGRPNRPNINIIYHHQSRRSHNCGAVQCQISLQFQASSSTRALLTLLTDRAARTELLPLTPPCSQDSARSNIVTISSRPSLLASSNGVSPECWDQGPCDAASGITLMCHAGISRAILRKYIYVILV